MLNLVSMEDAEEHPILTILSFLGVVELQSLKMNVITFLIIKKKVSDHS